MYLYAAGHTHEYTACARTGSKSPAGPKLDIDTRARLQGSLLALRKAFHEGLCPAAHILCMPIMQVRAERRGLGQQRTLAAMTWGGSMSGQASLPLSPATMPASEIFRYGASAWAGFAAWRAHRLSIRSHWKLPAWQQTGATSKAFRLTAQARLPAEWQSTLQQHLRWSGQGRI